MPENEPLGCSHDGVHLDRPHPLGSRLTPHCPEIMEKLEPPSLSPPKQSVRKETAVLVHWLKQSLGHCAIDTGGKLSHLKTAFFLLSRRLFASCLFPRIRKDGQPHASEIRHMLTWPPVSQTTHTPRADGFSCSPSELIQDLITLTIWQSFCVSTGTPATCQDGN